MFLPTSLAEAEWGLTGLVIIVLCCTIWNLILVRRFRKLVERRPK